MNKYALVSTAIGLAALTTFGAMAHLKHQKAEYNINSVIQKISQGEKVNISYEKIETSLFEKDIKLHNVKITPTDTALNLISSNEKNSGLNFSEGAEINEVIFYSDSYIPEKNPDNFKIDINGLRVPINKELASDTEREKLENFGIQDNIFINSSFGYNFNKEATTFSFNLGAGIDKVADLDFKFHMIGIETLIESEIAKMPNPTKNIKFTGATIKYKDNGFYRNLLNQVSKDSQKSVSDLKEEMITDIHKFLDAGINQLNKNNEKNKSELSNFVHNGGTLTIIARPEKHISMDQVMLMTALNPVQLISGLNLSIFQSN